jgi:transcriptional regulator with XRE-family HTH domain
MTTQAPAGAAFEEYCWQLRQLLAQSTMTRAELAARLEVTPATIKSWVTGRRSPTVRRLLELLALLEVAPGRLFDGPADMPAPVPCAACGRPFRRRIGYRIHLALAAKTCEAHAKLAGLHPVPPPAAQRELVLTK